jgi:hypothetical protein
MEEVSADIHAQNRKYLDQIVRNPEVRDGIRPAMAEEARADQFLADRGISLTPEAYDVFIDCVLEEYLAGVLLLKRRAGGDYRPDRRPEQFPNFEPAQRPHKDPAGLTPWKLFEMWVDAKKPAPLWIVSAGCSLLFKSTLRGDRQGRSPRRKHKLGQRAW